MNLNRLDREALAGPHGRNECFAPQQCPRHQIRELCGAAMNSSYDRCSNLAEHCDIDFHVKERTSR